MKKWLIIAIACFAALALTAQMALAGNAHFVGTPTISTSSDGTATASGKVAGLGNIDQISVIVTAEADCVNGGSHHPKAANKQTVKGGGNFPVQNGKADFSVGPLTATFQPDCAPPMVVVWKLIEVDVYTGCTNDVAADGFCTGGTLVLTYP